MTVEIVDLPSYKIVIFHSYVNVYQAGYISITNISRCRHNQLFFRMFTMMFTRCAKGCPGCRSNKPSASSSRRNSSGVLGGAMDAMDAMKMGWRWGISQGLSPFKWIRMGKIQDSRKALKGFKSLKKVETSEAYSMWRKRGDFGMPIESWRYLR